MDVTSEMDRDAAEAGKMGKIILTYRIAFPILAPTQEKFLSISIVLKAARSLLANEGNRTKKTSISPLA